MKLEQSFEVAAPVERVWQALIDVERVAPCLPGAAVTGRNDDGSYNGTFTVKIGPTSASYAGRLMMEKVDEAAHTATLQANGTDKRGQGSAKATIVSTLSPAADSRTRVELVTDYHITGRLARFGRGGMIEDISERLLREFANRLQGSLSGSDTSELASGRAAADGDGGAGRASPDGPREAADAPRAPEASREAPDAPREAAAASSSGGGSVGGAQATAGPGYQTHPIAPIPQTSEPVEGISLVGSVLWARVRRSPAPLAFIVGLVLALLVFRRRPR